MNFPLMCKYPYTYQRSHVTEHFSHVYTEYIINVPVVSFLFSFFHSFFLSQSHKHTRTFLHSMYWRDMADTSLELHGIFAFLLLFLFYYMYNLRPCDNTDAIIKMKVFSYIYAEKDRSAEANIAKCQRTVNSSIFRRPLLLAD